MQLEIIVTQKHLSHSAVPPARAPLCLCPSAQVRGCRTGSLQAGRFGQFPTAGAKLLIFHHWDLYPGGKLKQIPIFAVVPPACSSVLQSCRPRGRSSVGGSGGRTRSAPSRLEPFGGAGCLLVADDAVVRPGLSYKCCS